MVHHPVRTVDEVNQLDLAQFTAAFGDVLEASPHLAAAAWHHRPFADVTALAAAFASSVDDLDEEGALALLRAHPVLGATGPMAPASVGEQAGAGLRDLESHRREVLAAQNAAYLDRFGFPFIIAVAGLTPDDIDAALADRLAHTTDEELATALAEVRRIAALRLGAAVAP